MKRIGVIMHGITGRMGYNQHLVRSVLAIRDQGGVLLKNGERVMLDPILVGRNGAKIEEIARKHNVARWTTDIDAALANPDDTLFFDAGTTQMRGSLLEKAIKAGKNVYCEKPISDTMEEALAIARLAESAGIKHGVVQDKLFLPGLLKLRRLVDAGFFGRILSVRGEFGYWVFEGDWQEAQRPSWNYRTEDGGGIVLDMFPHWQYVLEHIIAPVRSVYAHTSTHIPERVDELGKPYPATADDAAYGVFELEGGIVAQINSSWTVRVNREELVEFQIDGTHGSAVAGLRECKFQSRAGTPKPVWNPDIPNTVPFRDQWQTVPDNGEFDNGFKIQWELFLKHVVQDAAGTPFAHDLWAGAKGVQLAELGLASAAEGRRLEVPELGRGA